MKKGIRLSDLNYRGVYHPPAIHHNRSIDMDQLRESNRSAKSTIQKRKKRK